MLRKPNHRLFLVVIGSIAIWIICCIVTQRTSNQLRIVSAWSWFSPSLFMKNGQGDVRPYVKYFSNGLERIDFLYTEGHPRDIDTSIYHCYYEGGALFRTDGTKISPLASDSTPPIAPEQGSLVFDGSSRPAWVWDIRRNGDGRVAAVFVVSHDGLDGFDLRYYYAQVLDGVWQTQEIGHSGKHLYSPENHYAGGVVLDT